MINCNIVAFVILYILAYYTNNNNIYTKHIYHLKYLLDRDLELYIKCINITNNITCGRITSNIKRKYKIVNAHKDLLFTSYYNTSSKKLATCNSNSNLFIVGIYVGPDYFIERFIYRKYYSIYNDIQIYFFSGISSNNTINKMVRIESSIYKDIVLFPFLSSYYTSAQTVVSEFNWISNNCMKYKWFIHHQADVYLNITKLKIMLETINCSKCCLGPKLIGIPVIRLKSHRYYIPDHLYPKRRTWPHYMCGILMIFPHNTINILIKSFDNVKPRFWPDDIYIGLMLDYSNITLVDLKEWKIEPNMLINKFYMYYIIHDIYPPELYYLSLFHK